MKEKKKYTKLAILISTILISTTLSGCISQTPIYRTETKNIINGKILIGNNMISNHDFVLQRPSKINGNFNVDGNYIAEVKIYNVERHHNVVYSTGKMIRGEVSTEELPSGNYYIAYENPNQHTITITTKVDATYNICIQNCNN